MSRVLFVRFRTPDCAFPLSTLINLLKRRLCPDNIDPVDPLVQQDGLSTLVIFQPSEVTNTHALAACIGQRFSSEPDWWLPGGSLPDGTYALFRASNDAVELATDFLGTRSIWYVQTPEIFAASTSQRALVSLLQDFQPNTQAVSWMFASGTLGPENSWERRIRLLPADSVLHLSFATWQIKLQTVEPVYDSHPLSKEVFKDRLNQALTAQFDPSGLDFSRWVLPLSGGVDSRAILVLLAQNHVKMDCVTWGVTSSLADPANDASIAKKLAEHYGFAHRYFATDRIESLPVDTILNRFFVAGEGRVDHISAYTDGFFVWKQLYDSGVRGIIRGDECFGWHNVSASFDVRRSVNLRTLSDFERDHIPGIAELDTVEVPASLQQRPGETLAGWRDRLYQSYRVPAVLAALTDLKTAYVEVMNPFLSKRILSIVRQMPDNLRTEKVLFKQIVSDLGPPLPFAAHSAMPKAVDIFRDPAVIELLQTGLAQCSTTALPPTLTRYLSQQLLITVQPSRPAAHKSGFLTSIKQFIPARFRSAIRQHITRPALDPYTVAFRAYLIMRMHAILEEDSKLALNSK